MNEACLHFSSVSTLIVFANRQRMVGVNQFRAIDDGLGDSCAEKRVQG